MDEHRKTPTVKLGTRHKHYSPLDVCEVYGSDFAGRHDVYWLGMSDGTYRLIRQELTSAVIVRAFWYDRCLAFDALGADGLTHTPELDFDTDDGWIEAQTVGSFLWDRGIPAYVERSRRGGHLFIVLDWRIPAAAARLGLRAALQQVGLDDTDPKRELRPSSDRAPAQGGVGKALRGPMMPHPLTGDAYPLCDPRTGQPIGQTVVETLLELQLAPAHGFVALGGLYRRPVEPARPGRSVYPYGTARRELAAKVGVSQVLRDHWGVNDAVLGRTIRCPAHDDVHPSLSITRDDRKAICHSPSCDFHNNGRGRDTYDLIVLSSARELSVK